MQTIGNYLKSGREARNIRLSEVARSTKISKWYLDCLEKDEFDKIPGGPYIKGYIASYASYIGIEEDEILKRYDSLQLNDEEENEVQDLRTQKRNRQKSKSVIFGKKHLLVLSIAIGILCISGFIFYSFQNQSHFVDQLQDTQGSKTLSQPVAEKENNESGTSPLKDSALTVTSKEKAPPKLQDTAGTKSLARLPTEKKNDRVPPPLLPEENSVSAKIAIRKEPAILDTLPLLEAGNTGTAAAADSKTTSSQDTPLAVGKNSVQAQVDQSSTASDNLNVVRAVAASDIQNKNPANIANAFSWSTERVYIWSRIECKQPPSSIRHIYYFEGHKVNDIELKIKSPQWRTWSYKTLLEKRWIGQWKVDITSVEGELLQRIFFEVK
jgi:cytoskeletal protein RodZ